jgi:hypothetical protein
MASYKVRVTDGQGRLVVGATLSCPDDAAARARFESLPLPEGLAELTLGARVVARRGLASARPAQARG